MLISLKGPTEHTVTDFWRMIWEKDVDLIVMLTNPVEGATVSIYCVNTNVLQIFKGVDPRPACSHCGPIWPPPRD